MKVKQVFLIFCITVLTAVYGFSADLKVISAKPKGTLNYAGRTPVSVTFNQPVAALSEESAFAREDCPLQIIPAVAGTCRFSGTQTLQFEPEQDWTDATQYTVTLPGSFSSQVSKAQLAEDYRFSFTTQRPEVQEVIPYDKEQWIDVRPLIFVILNQPVNLASAQQAVRVTYPGKAAPQPGWWERLKAFFLGVDLNIRPAEIAVPVKVRPLTDQEFEEKFSYRKKNYIFVVELEKDLPSDTQITFSVSRALRGQSGNLGPEKDFISVFYTYPPLEIAGGNFKGCLPFESQIAFTSPVRLEELLKHIKVSPESVLTEVTEQEKQTLGYQYYATRRTAGEQEQGTIVALPEGKGYFAMPLSFLRLPPNEEVTITLDKNLADIYGQKLGADLTIRLRNNGYCPAVVFKDGTGVLESYLPLRHPIDVLNEAELEVSAGRFNRDNIIAFLEKDAHYCQEKEIAAADLQYKGKYQFEITEDKTKKTYLDLTRFHPTAHDSVIYSQVRLPSKYREEGYCWKGATDNITDMGVTLKTAQENMLVWVTSLKDGMPKAEAKVELRDGKNRILWTGITDKNGLAVAPGTKALSAQSRNSWSRPVIYAFVTSENGDAVLASDWNDGIEPWRFNLPFSYSNEPNNFKTALFTDRGIYRPGETVYVKGITRQQKQGEWVLPYLTQETVKVYNSREEEILKDTLKYTNKGSFDWKFNLPENAATGTWRIDTEENSYTFRVEAVKQADFEVHLRPLKNAFLSGEKAEFTASADYLFGAPVAKAKAKWNVRLADEWFHPTGYEEYEFEPYFLRRDEKSTEGLLAESSAELDEQGKLNFAVNLPKVTHRQNIYTELGVQAPTGQQLFARTNTTLNPADFYLGAYMERWATEVSEPVKTHLIAIDTEGKLTGGMQVKADIQKEEYFSVRKNGLAGRLEWVSERKTQAIGSQSFVMTEKGYDFSFVPEKPGNYLITLSAKDKQGREVRGGFSVMVYGKGEGYWKQNDDDILILKQEKDKYNVGETARILVQSPYEKAMALITVERKGILDSWVKQINGGADYVDVPIKENYMPNVFVSVTLVHGRAEKAMYDKEGLDLAKPQAKIGYARLTVSQTEREIQTQVTPARTQYQPGEEVEVQLQTALQGKEVSAEVTVMAVDEGVLSLTGYKLPDLVKFSTSRKN